jgi:hypothetical protein
MTFQELLEVYNGQFIEIAGTTAQNQCVDLANSYIKYVLRLPAIEWTNAVDFPSKAGDAFEYILNTPTGVPQEGDLVIWGGTYGHIAIFIEGNTTRFTSYDQNYPTGSPCHVQEHTYLSPKVLGWMRPKNVPQDNEIELQKCVNARNSHWDNLLKIKDALVISGDFALKLVLDRIDSLLTTEREYGKQQGVIKTANDRITELEKQLLLIQPAHDETAQTVQEVSVKVDEQGQAIKDVSTGIQEVKDTLAKPDWSALKMIWEGIKKLLLGK